MNLLDLARAAIRQHVPSPSSPGREGGEYPAIATPEQEAELRSLVAIFLANDIEAERVDAMTAALADPDSALTSFRILAAEFAAQCAHAREADDDRRCCTDCTNLATQDRRCLAAWRGERIGNAGRNYHPAIDVPGRCDNFAPLAKDVDQRTGAERWQRVTKSES